MKGILALPVSILVISALSMFNGLLYMALYDLCLIPVFGMFDVSLPVIGYGTFVLLACGISTFTAKYNDKDFSEPRSADAGTDTVVTQKRVLELMNKANGSDDNIRKAVGVVLTKGMYMLTLLLLSLIIL